MAEFEGAPSSTGGLADSRAPATDTPRKLGPAITGLIVAAVIVAALAIAARFG